MESIPLDMDGIFGDGEDGNDNNFSALPDLPEELAPLDGHDGDDIPPTQDAENAEILAKLKGMKGAGKKVVRKPQPKLDASRLTGERGIAILPKVFKDVKFKGKGHEADDLRVTMKYLEHWAHRLFPMMPFDEVLERVEKLGSKKEVQTCIKKMRLDIPVLGEDFVGEPEHTEEGPISPERSGEMDAEDAFDQMMREEQEQRLQSQHAPAPTAIPDPPPSPPPSSPPPVHTQTPTPVPAAVSTAPVGLTPEQREKMERNKRLAMEKRAARLAAQAAAKESSTSNQTSSQEVKEQILSDKHNIHQSEDKNTLKNDSQAEAMETSHNTQNVDNKCSSDINVKESTQQDCDGQSENVSIDNERDEQISANEVGETTKTQLEDEPRAETVEDKSCKDPGGVSDSETLEANRFPDTESMETDEQIENRELPGDNGDQPDKLENENR